MDQSLMKIVPKVLLMALEKMEKYPRVLSSQQQKGIKV